MDTTAFGIMQDSEGNGTSPRALRKCIQARWGNTGIVTGLKVTGRSDLRYNVAAGVAVVSRSDSDGFSEAYWDGGQTPEVQAGNSANPRIDLVWIKANDLQQGDDDNLVHVGVTSGTASGTPVAPQCPAGCTPLALMLVPAGASSTSGASLSSDGDLAIPYGATLGLLGENVDTRDMVGDNVAGAWYYENAVEFTVPTDRLVELIYSCTFSNTPSNTGDFLSWGVAAFQIDGEDVPHSGTEWQATNNIWEDHEVSCLVEVSAGTHVARVRNGKFAGSPSNSAPYFHYTTGGGLDAERKGRTLRVWDRGVVS